MVGKCLEKKKRTKTTAHSASSYKSQGIEYSVKINFRLIILIIICQNGMEIKCMKMKFERHPDFVWAKKTILLKIMARLCNVYSSGSKNILSEFVNWLSPFGGSLLDFRLSEGI